MFKFNEIVLSYKDKYINNECNSIKVEFLLTDKKFISFKYYGFNFDNVNNFIDLIYRCKNDTYSIVYYKYRIYQKLLLITIILS